MLAHVPDIDDFVAGLARARPGGTITVEFPHLLRLVQEAQFDTIYHEHFSYLSLRTVHRIFAAQGLAVWDVEALPTHGGSLRVWAQHAANPRPPRHASRRCWPRKTPPACAARPSTAACRRVPTASSMSCVGFLVEQKRAGRIVAAYGAAAKGNTLLNYAGVRPDLLPFVVDASPHKQGRFLPGSRIPVSRRGAAAALPRLRADPAVEPARGDPGRPRRMCAMGRRGS